MEAGGKGIKGKNSLQVEAEPVPSTAGHLWGSTGMPLDLVWLLCREPALTHSQVLTLSRRFPAAPVQGSVSLDGVEIIPLSSSFNLIFNFFIFQ